MFGRDVNSRHNKVHHIQGGVCRLAVLEVPFACMSVVVLFSQGAGWCDKMELHSFLLTSGTFCTGI